MSIAEEESKEIMDQMCKRRYEYKGNEMNPDMANDADEWINVHTIPTPYKWDKGGKMMSYGDKKSF